MRLPIYQVDAFASRLFTGNPAAVCPLEAWLPDHLLQSIAAENNLAETAFFVKEAAGYRLRWFTPATEVDLCGHATLAAAHVLFTCLGLPGDQVIFSSRSGPLAVHRESGGLTLDFPAQPPAPRDPSPAIAAALGGHPRQWLATARDVIAVYDDENEVAALEPDMHALLALPESCFVATAPGRVVDFVSRFFAPAYGIPEDPVTGSAHCALTPYWAERLGKTAMRARQLSARGGELQVALAAGRVAIGGQAVLYLEGFITVDR